MTLQALRFAGIDPILVRRRADMRDEPALYQRRSGLRGVPSIGVATPIPGIGMPHEQARLDELTSEPEVLDEHCAIRERPITVRRNRDLSAVGECHPALLVRAI